MPANKKRKLLDNLTNYQLTLIKKMKRKMRKKLNCVGAHMWFNLSKKRKEKHFHYQEMLKAKIWATNIFWNPEKRTRTKGHFYLFFDRLERMVSAGREAQRDPGPRIELMILHRKTGYTTAEVQLELLIWFFSFCLVELCSGHKKHSWTAYFLSAVHCTASDSS